MFYETRHMTTEEMNKTQHEMMISAVAAVAAAHKKYDKTCTHKPDNHSIVIIFTTKIIFLFFLYLCWFVFFSFFYVLFFIRTVNILCGIMYDWNVCIQFQNLLIVLHK